MFVHRSKEVITCLRAGTASDARTKDFVFPGFFAVIFFSHSINEIIGQISSASFFDIETMGGVPPKNGKKS